MIKSAEVARYVEERLSSKGVSVDRIDVRPSERVWSHASLSHTGEVVIVRATVEITVYSLPEEAKA